MDIFDRDWYATLVGQTMHEESLRKHYRDIGRFKNLSPSPYFEHAWYVKNANISADPDMDPVEHFVKYEAADPHPLFNSKWYKWNYLGDIPNENPLLHYIQHGWRAGYNPHPLFWLSWYRDKYIKNLVDIDPFYHFLIEGHAKGYNPNPLFDVSWYVETYRLPSDVNSLTDYIYGGHFTRDPHPLFDSEHYRLVVDCEGLSPLEHYLTKGRGVSPSVMFDVAYFIKNNKSSRTNSDHPELVQYIDLASHENVDPHPLFSRKFYYQNNPDVRSLDTEALYHYARVGAREGKQPHPLFEPDFYWEQFPDRRYSNPLIDYLNHSVDSAARPRRPRDPDTSQKLLPPSRRVIRLTGDAKTINRQKQDVRIGVFAHIFYSDLSDYIVRYTNNIREKCTIYISTSSVIDAKIIRKVFEETSRHDFVIRVAPNRGRDIAPMLVTFRDALESCDYALHVHTKKSKHYSRDFDEWRNYLFDMNLGTPELVTAILDSLDRPDVGAVAPDHFAPIKPLIQWGGNFHNVEQLMLLCGEQISPRHILDLPSGSMFWFKTKALKKLLDLNLEYYHFDPEADQVDGTLAHAIERAFFYFVEMTDHEWIVHHPDGCTLSDQPSKCKGSIGNRFFPNDRDLGVTRKYYPECTNYLVRPSDVEKPRINLLIPVIDQDKGYAGAATAIEIFMKLAHDLKGIFDARVIATNISMSNQYVAPKDFRVVSCFDDDIPNQNTVIDGAQRYLTPIFFRRNDILFATAWWTAAGALNIMDQQRKFFKQTPEKFVYLIQDYESSFYPRSTKFALAERTYCNSSAIIPIFNTEILASFFRENTSLKSGHVLLPGINKQIDRHIQRNRQKEKIVLLYARPHADRNCLPFLDMLVSDLTKYGTDIWRDWQFIAIGEDFDGNILRCTDRIRVLGRLTLEEYGDLASRAALAVSLMMSPHPSYPPMELASAGVLVLTNNCANKDMSNFHDNITSFDTFCVSDVSQKLTKIAHDWLSDTAIGWRGKPKIDWFFNGQSNIDGVIQKLSVDVRNNLVPKMDEPSKNLGSDRR
ncbi:rhamnan synthesis F family protein [Methylobacterium tarhaniae]|uniref:rhamnosyltransferase WsaF family glycosyltransferase n=1 Tax=Methylobacterium tarhaniae TaxID=1187852 RepID=UPI0009F82427|nr:rhamnan synthesis F family protein [Methylobacterium tarhaniae]